jgi:ParB-like chromosome segregation protein Spo0J
VLSTHPACELFPMLPDVDLVELGENIRAHGLLHPIIILSQDNNDLLLDGCNRLDAMVRVGIKFNLSCRQPGWWNLDILDENIPSTSVDLAETLGGDVDPYAYVLAANVHRRHLTAEQKRDLIAKLLKAEPAKSDRQISKMVKVDHKTVGAVRAKKEACGEIPHVEERKDTKGRAQPAKKAKADQIERDRKACIALNQKVVEAEEERAQFTCSCPACMSRGSHAVPDAEAPQAETAAKRAFFAQRIRNALAGAQSELKGMFDAAGEIGLTEVMLADFLDNTPHTAETHAIVRKWLDAGEAAS